MTVPANCFVISPSAGLRRRTLPRYAMLPELLISDFAGTAFRDDGAILDAYRFALGRYEVPFEDAELATRRGANKHAVLLEFVARVVRTSDAAEVLARQALADFEAHLTESYTSGPVSEIDGAEAVFGSSSRPASKWRLQVD